MLLNLESLASNWLRVAGTELCTHEGDVFRWCRVLLVKFGKCFGLKRRNGKRNFFWETKRRRLLIFVMKKPSMGLHSTTHFLNCHLWVQEPHRNTSKLINSLPLIACVYQCLNLGIVAPLSRLIQRVFITWQSHCYHNQGDMSNAVKLLPLESSNSDAFTV